MIILCMPLITKQFFPSNENKQICSLLSSFFFTPYQSMHHILQDCAQLEHIKSALTNVGIIFLRSFGSF